MIEVRPNADAFNAAWNAFLDAEDPLRASYSPGTRGYHVQSILDEGYTWTDESLIVLSDDREPLGAFLGGVRRRDGAAELSYGDIPCAAVLARRGLEGRQADRLLTRHVKRLLGPGEVTGGIFVDCSGSTLSGIATWLASRGAEVTLRITRQLDLTLPEAELWRNLRKSYKNLINRGQREIEIRYLDAENPSAEGLEEFRRLHADVAGRETRSPAAWDERLRQIREGAGFGVLGYLEGELATAGFFICAGPSCYYGSSASKRELFDKPMFHALMWTAIKKARSMGFAFFEVGSPEYDLRGVEVTAKERNVGKFKAGFGGFDMTRVELEWQDE